VSNRDTFNQELSGLLDLIDQEPLEQANRDILARGVAIARESGQLHLTLPLLQEDHPRAVELGESVLAKLRSADEELPPEEVDALDALVRERLPETL
jgi:hypothetical protein